MKDAITLFRFLIEAQARGERTALVTITAVEGASSRAPGTHMAVTGSGAFLGSFSGGCVEAAVVGEALRVMASGKAERLRLGAGSRFIDIRLPCGGAVEMLLTPAPPAPVLREALTRLSERRVPVCLLLDTDGGVAIAQTDHATGALDDDRFIARHDPDLRLVILGHGAETPALARLGSAYGAEVRVLTPDLDIVASCETLGIAATHLRTAGRSPGLTSDSFTAVVLLFHDHDWETGLLAQALEGDAFFIGAMGSRLTQQRRREALLRHGVPAATIARVVGPIGLIPATRDADTLALSTLAQIAEWMPGAAADGGHRAIRVAGPIDDERASVREPSI